MRYIPELASLSLVVSGAFASCTPDVSNKLQNILKNTDKSTGYQYPTDFTRDIVPKAIHSHNDYWRAVPFYTALSNGAISVEADVWLVNGTLYIGHEQAALTPSRTFQSLYIDPILSTLALQNPKSRFVPANATKNGVFDTSSSQTLYLFVDVKTPGPETWPAVLEALKPLRDGGWLSTYNVDKKEWKDGAVTVVGTGNTPLDLVRAAKLRDAFFDGPLALLNTTDYANLTKFEAPVASTNLIASVGDIRSLSGLSDKQKEIVKAQVGQAKEKGILARYWNTPGWPINVRNAVWKGLWEGGVGLLGADDVEAAAEFWQTA